MAGSVDDFVGDPALPGPGASVQQLTPTLAIEDHGTEFYVVSRGEGHDLTLSLDADVAERLALFILERRGHRPAASILPLGRQDQREDQDSDH